MTTAGLKAGSWRANVTPLPGARRRGNNKGVGQRIARPYHEDLRGRDPGCPSAELMNCSLGQNRGGIR